MNKSNKDRKESVWDYPRPPRVEISSQSTWVVFNGIVIAKTNKPLRVLETSHPPTYYFPPESVQHQYLFHTNKKSLCEFKGIADYYTIEIGKRLSENAAWSYHSPNTKFASLKDYVAFYPGLVDACYVDGERVQAQEGDFYGGWITSVIEGPFKGGRGTAGW
jgi:uncharacterized protein (DUF427 family)